MSTEIVVVDDFEKRLEAQKELVKNLFCKDGTKDEFEFFFLCCKRFKLDPFAKHIYFTKLGGKVTMITSIEGFRAVAERTGKYAPGKDTEFTYDKAGKLHSAKVFVKKMTLDGTWHEMSATALWAEYGIDGRGVSKKNVWGEKPHVMLEKCAEARALRRAFTMELSGLYGEGELDRAEIAQEQKEQVKQEQLQQAEVVQENEVFTKTLQECEKLAPLFWGMLREKCPTLPNAPMYDIRYYLLYAQSVLPNAPIESRFEGWATNHGTLLKSMKSWFESKKAQNFIHALGESERAEEEFQYERAE